MKNLHFFKIVVIVLISFLLWKNTYASTTRVNFANTLRAEYYEVMGDKTSSPYPYEGWQPYDEVSFDLVHRKNPYNLWKFNMFGVVGDSDYRTPDDKIILERVNILKEQGDVYLPYRLEAGDYYAFFSYRTLQTSLKGFQMELQPQWGIERGMRHSFILLGGVNGQTWNDFKLKENITGGISYLLEDNYGKYSFNTIYNKRYPTDGIPEIRQQIYSITMEQYITAWDKLLFEGEIAYFNGDHQDPNGGVAQDKSGWGIFGQVQNQSTSSLFYRFRYEDYDADYAPQGAAVSPDYRSYEAHLGYKFKKGLTTRIRWQRFENNIHTSRTISKIMGINFLGSINLFENKSLSTNIDMSIQNTEPEDGNEVKNKVITTNFLYPLFKNVNSRWRFSYMKSDDDVSSREASLGLDISHSLFNAFQCNLSPSIGYRVTDYGTDREKSTFLGLSEIFQGKNQNLNFNLNYSSQNLDKGIDVENINYGVTYQYNIQKHVISLEVVGTHRNPSQGGVTNSYKIVTMWTYYFNKEIKRKNTATPLILKEEPKHMDISIFSYIQLGQSISEVISLFRDLRAPQYIRYGNALIYEIKIFEDIEKRQRLVIEEKNGKIEKVAVIFEPVTNAEEALRELAKINNLLIRKYGSPASFYEKGDVSKNFFQDVRDGNFIRIYEWALEDGILRVGIPARLDETVRIEVQFAKSFPPYNYYHWGLDSIK